MFCPQGEECKQPRILELIALHKALAALPPSSLENVFLMHLETFPPIPLPFAMTFPF